MPNPAHRFTSTVIVAAGSGTRLGANRPKAFVMLWEQTLLEHSVSALAPHSHQIVIVAPAELVESTLELFAGNVPLLQKITVVAGGDTRAASVAQGLTKLAPLANRVLIHDAARCLVPNEVIARTLAALDAGDPGVIPVIDATDSMRQVDASTGTSQPVDRNAFKLVQTPQGFQRSIIEAAHLNVDIDTSFATDDAMLVEMLGHSITLVEGHIENFKITRPSDLLLARAILQERQHPDTQEHPHS